jgi:hypothetical protein
MSDNNSFTTPSTQNKKGRKAGRTLLVKPENNNFDTKVFSSLDGLSSQYHIEKSNSHFLTFETVENSLKAYRQFRNDYNSELRVKFAHYRVFFTLQGLSEDNEYSDVKTAHIKFVCDNTKGNVLYYKLYRKNDSYLGCGDMTLDTKESFDQLINSESEHKNFNFLESLTGVHYRYNRTQQDSTSQHATV